jgi:hypothetical protein
MPVLRAAALCLLGLALPLAVGAETPPAYRIPITHEKLWMMKRVGNPEALPLH